MTSARTITVTQFDSDRLWDAIREAQQQDYRGSTYIENLKAELQRAEIVSPQQIPQDVITMNSKVRLLDLDSGEEMVFTLVFPKDADIQQDRISILAPVGTAVLGYRLGDTIEWQVPDGLRRLKVTEVLFQPEASGNYEL